MTPALSAGGRPPGRVLVRPTRHRASPRARRLAADRGVAPAAVTGTGPHGHVIARDVLRCTETRAPHQHSPRMRRLARELGVEPEAAVPTGPAGRLRAADLERLATACGSSTPATAVELDPPPTPVSAAGTALRSRSREHDSASIEVRVAAGATDDLLVAVVAALSAAVAERDVDVLVRRYGAGTAADVLVRGARHLGADGIRAALAGRRSGLQAIDDGGPSGGASTVVVHDLTSTALVDADLAPDAEHLAALTLGPPLEQALVVEADGGWGVGVGSVARIGLAWEAGFLPTPEAVDLLEELRRRLDPTTDGGRG